MPSTAIYQANQIPMWQACKIAGMEVSAVTGNRKLPCPFGDFSHPDGGREPAFRIYGSHAFCFACWEYYTPVRLCAQMWDLSEEMAAHTLLARAGIIAPDYITAWNKALAETAIDRDALAQALKTRCLSLPGEWETLQYHPLVSEYLARCLGLLQQVHTEEEARHWLDTCAAVMRVVTIGAQDVSG